MFAVVTVRACQVKVEVVPFILRGDLSSNWRFLLGCQRYENWCCLRWRASILSLIVVVGSRSNEV